MSSPFVVKTWLSVLAGACLLFVQSSAYAEPDKSDLTFEAVLTQTLLASPLVKDIDVTFSQALSESYETRLLPNPELSAEAAFPTSNSDAKNEYGVSIAQPFRLSHLGLRQKVASLIESAASDDQRFALVELTEKTRLAYVRLWALQQQRSYFLRARERARKVVRFVREGATKGLFSQGEEKIFVAEDERATADLLGLDAETKKATAELIQLSTLPIGDKALREPPTATDNDLTNLSAAAQSSALPIQRRLSLLQKLSSERMRLARRDAFPALSPQIGFSRNEDGVEFLGAGLTMGLPFYNRNQGEKLLRSSELQAAMAKRDFVESDVFKSQLSLLVDGLRGSLRQANAYRDKVLPSLEAAISVYEKQLQSGQGTVLLTWQTQRELLDLQARHLEIWVRAFSEQSELAILTGNPL